MDLRLHAEFADREALTVEGRIVPPAESSGRPYLRGRLEKAETKVDFEFESAPPLAWINELVRTFTTIEAVFSGGDLMLRGNLSGKGLLLEGQLQAALRDLHVSFSDSVDLAGLSGDWDFRVNGFPQSYGIQELRIDSITTGSLVLTDALVEWVLPTMGMLRVLKAETRLSGGRVTLDPFGMDPASPEVRTRLRFHDLPANILMDLLGEKRFRIDGEVSGSLAVQWRDGIIYLGDGSLGMNTSRGNGRFVFTDPSFLEEQFSALSGIPAKLRQPLLQVLLDRGIRIERLSLDLIPLRERGEVSLRLEVSGETANEYINVPIRGFVINNIISEEDLGRLLGLMGPVRFLPGS